MALAVCLLFDARTERALRQLWRHLEDDGIATLHSHTHRRHVPHVSYAVLRSWDLGEVRAAVAGLPDRGPVAVHLDALGLFRRNRSWLLPGTDADLRGRQRAVVAALADTSADLHWHYRPGTWIPHCTLAPRVRMDQLATLATAVYDVLPIVGVADRAALVDSGSGAVHPLSHVP
jgi:hypothetical protein